MGKEAAENGLWKQKLHVVGRSEMSRAPSAVSKRVVDASRTQNRDWNMENSKISSLREKKKSRKSIPRRLALFLSHSSVLNGKTPSLSN